MRVFVLGGTGAIGRPAVAALLDAGHEVSALARSEERAAGLRDLGARPVRGSIFDHDGLALAFRGHHAVVNLATSQPSTAQFLWLRAWRDTERIRTEGAATVVDAALTAGVEAVLQESVVMLYADQGAEWVDESAPVDEFPMARGNHAAERSAHRFSDAGGVGIVLRFGFFYGTGARHAEQFLTMGRFGVVPVLGRPDGYLSSIHVDDGGRAVAAALDLPAGIYNVVDDEPLTKRDYAAAIASAAGRTPLIRGPGRLAELLGHRTTSLTRSVRATNAKLRAATDWRPRYPSGREGWPAMAESR